MYIAVYVATLVLLLRPLQGGSFSRVYISSVHDLLLVSVYGNSRFASCVANYHGSIGYGQDFVNSLLSAGCAGNHSNDLICHTHLINDMSVPIPLSSIYYSNLVQLTQVVLE